MDKIEACRRELDKIIEEHGYNMSDESVVKKSLELERKVYEITKKEV